MPTNMTQTKYKQSKAEANTAQNRLQKEITTLREAHRSLQLRLRDIEVANDDYEKQARNTTSSLEDLESKYNVSIERGVMMEEEIKASEQDREALRIEAQRLRDELSDLKIEADIRQEKLQKAEATMLLRPGDYKTIEQDTSRPATRQSERSPMSTATSSPTIATPPTKSASSIVSETPTPPSPPTSDHSLPPLATPNGIAQTARQPVYQPTMTPKPTNFSRPTRHTRDPSSSYSCNPPNRDRPTPYPRRTTLNRQERPNPPSSLPTSQSLHQIRNLRGKMSSLQERINSARSKLPAPTNSSPHSSPRNNSAMGQASIPPTITMRSNKKRTSGSNVSSSIKFGVDRPSLSRPASRLSFGYSHPSASPEKPNLHAPTTSTSRPTSRHSISSRTSISHLPSAAAASTSASTSNQQTINSRPSSRQSLTGASQRTPYNTNTYNSNLGATISESRRPRSSIGGSYATMHAHHLGHGHSASISRSHNRMSIQNSNLFDHATDEDDETSEVVTPTPARRTTASRDDFAGHGGSGIPSLVPNSTGGGKRVSGIGMGASSLAAASSSKRMSSGLGGIGARQKENHGGVAGDMPPPPAASQHGVQRRPESRLEDSSEETF